MLTTARNRAKTKSVPFDITEDDLDIPVFCPVLGIKLERAGTGSGRNDNAPSLDRIIPELGYVRGNVMVISNKANRLKNNGTAEELRRIADFYTKLERKDEWQKKTTTTGPTASPTSTASGTPSKTTTAMTRSFSRSPSPSRGVMHGNVALIDGDIFAYKAAFGNESVVPLGDDVVHLEANLAETESTLEGFIDGIKDKLNAERVIVCLSDDTKNFRKSIYAPYKENRTLVRKPLALRFAKEHLKKKFGAKVKDSLEADDVLAIFCTHPTLIKGKPIIVTIDKDLLQIPGRHFNPDKDVKRMIGESEAELNFLTQVLTGDHVDHYPGCPGIGPKRAAAILEKDRSWSAIVATYEKAKLTENDALVQARVARILRHGEFDYDTKQPVLWTPDKER